MNWKFIAAASQALTSKASKVRFVRGLAQVRTTTSYVTSHSHGLGDIVACHSREANIFVDVGAHDRIHGIQEVIKAIHSEQQSVSYEALEIETLAFVLTESLEKPRDGNNALNIFFRTQTPTETAQCSPNKLSSALCYYVKYVRNAPPSQIRVVAHYILRQLQDLLSPKDPSQWLRIMQLFQVAVYFAHHSQTFSEVLVENGILDIVFKV